MRTVKAMLAALLAVWPLGVQAEGGANAPVPVQATAPATADVARLLDVMQIDATIEVMRAEGMAHGALLEQEMFLLGDHFFVPNQQDWMQGVY